MARILFCEYSNVTWLNEQMFDAHAQAFVNALMNEGNDVLGIVTNHVVTSIFINKVRWWLVENKIHDIIKKFNPQLIISYNNSLPGRDVLSYTDCPILVYPADVFDIWADRDRIADNIDRYFFLDVTDRVTKRLKSAIPSIKSTQIIPFGHVTGVYATEEEQDINISFVGSLCNYAANIPLYFSRLGEKISAERANEEKNRFLQMYDRHVVDCSDVDGYDFVYCDDSLKNELKTTVNYELDTMLSCNKRFRILSALTEYGLEIFGYPPSWGEVMIYNMDLFRCFNYRTSVTLEDTIRTYNRSRIVLNLPQGTSTDGFSWRVPDALASNAVLMSVPKRDLSSLLTPYYRDYPFYESETEARELARKLISDESYRRELVLAAHEMVEEHLRFPKKIRTISEAIPDITLCEEQKAGKIRCMTAEELCFPYIKVEKFFRKHTYMSRICKVIYKSTKR